MSGSDVVIRDNKHVPWADSVYCARPDCSEHVYVDRDADFEHYIVCSKKCAEIIKSLEA